MITPKLRKQIMERARAEGQILLRGAQSLLTVDFDLKHIQNMFDNPNHQIIAMRWYNTVEQMR